MAPSTFRFGPWAPDLDDVGIEFPPQFNDVEIPVADCQNVYWQDGAYRCIPGLSAFGPSLGTPILDCFTWYDNTAQKEVLFAATANGFFTMVDGVWTQISIQVTEGTVGLAITIQLGSPTGLATAMSPTSLSASGTSSSNTFSALTAVIGYGTATSYTWSFTGVTGPGTWSISSGAGTKTAVPKVTGCTSGTTSTATAQCTIVFGGHSYVVTAALSYTENTPPPPAPLTRTYTTAGSGVETIPSGGYTHVVIEVKGGGGGNSDSSGTDPFAAGGGGAGYCRTSMAITAGKTFNWAVGVHGGENIHGNGTVGQPSTVSSGTMALTTMTANGGGGSAANGVGGTASGGNQANATGANGVNGGAGGASTAGVNFDTGNTYGHGAAFTTGAGVSSGFVVFHYT